jgi:hypothetical protein
VIQQASDAAPAIASRARPRGVADALSMARHTPLTCSAAMLTTPSAIAPNLM